MPAPEYKEELHNSKFPVDANTRPVSVLYTYDPVTGQFGPVTSEGVTGVGQVLNTNIVGGVMQVENLHVDIESTGVRDAADQRINPAQEDGNLATAAAGITGMQDQLAQFKFDGDNLKVTGNIVVDAVTVENPGGTGAVNIQDGGNSITVDGSVSVSNLPVTQGITGSVNVDNFPTLQGVSGTFWQDNQPVTAGQTGLWTVGVTGTVSATIDKTGLSTEAGQTAGNATLSAICAGITGIKAQTDLMTFESGATGATGAVGMSVFPRGDLQGGFTPDPWYQPCDTNRDQRVPMNFSRGLLNIRGPVLTDEGSYRDDFGGDSLSSISAGTALFTNNSILVTGTGFLADGLDRDFFIRATAQTDAEFTAIDRVESDTQLYLVEPYTGATTELLTYTKSKWEQTIVGSGTIAVANSKVSLTGTLIDGDVMYVRRSGDYGPMCADFRANVSQRIVNQIVRLGFASGCDVCAHAGVLLSGVDNTVGIFSTASESDPTTEEATQFTIPLGKTTDEYLDYHVLVDRESASLFVNKILVAVHHSHIPGPYDALAVGAQVLNTGAVASATTLNIDNVYFGNHNTVQVEQAEKVNVQDISGSLGATGATVSVDTNGFTSHAAVVTGTWSGIIVAESSSDGGTTWRQCTVFQASATIVGAGIPTVASDIRGNGTYQFGVGGPVTAIRLRSSTYTSGPASVRLVSTPASTMFGFSNSAIIQKGVVSLLNSTTANLGATAGFTGTSESTLGAASLAILVIADQALTVYIDQSPDGTNWDVVDSYVTFAGIGTARTVKAMGAFFRLRAVNNSVTTATTYLRISSTLTPIAEPLPRTLGQKLTSRSLSVTIASDQNGIETVGDLVFSASLDLNFSTTSETNFVLLRNPAASGKRLNIQKIVLDAAGKPTLIRLSYNPTSITPGTAMTLVNRHIGSAVVSSMTASYSPTATAVGANKIGTFSSGTAANSMIDEVKGLIVLEPGNDLLFTAQAGSNNTLTSLTVTWLEPVIAQ